MDGPRPLDGRYRFLRRVEGGPTSVIWLARDQRTEETVVCSLLPISRVAGLQKAISFHHPNLAAVLEVLHDVDIDELPEGIGAERSSAIVVAEHVPGTTLYQRMARARLSPGKGVANVAKLAAVLAEMHERGAVHGAISPRSVVIERADGKPGPLLTQVLMPPDGAFCSPERVTGGGPSAHDDTWALHATLYCALTGQPPFKAESQAALARRIVAGRPLPLAVFDAGDDQLQHTLDRGLTPRTSERNYRVEDLSADLFVWLSARGRTPDDELALAEDDSDDAHREPVETWPSIEPPPMDGAKAASPIRVADATHGGEPQPKLIWTVPPVVGGIAPPEDQGGSPEAVASIDVEAPPTPAIPPPAISGEPPAVVAVAIAPIVGVGERVAPEPLPEPSLAATAVTDAATAPEPAPIPPSPVDPAADGGIASPPQVEPAAEVRLASPPPVAMAAPEAEARPAAPGAGAKPMRLQWAIASAAVVAIAAVAVVASTAPHGEGTVPPPPASSPSAVAPPRQPAVVPAAVTRATASAVEPPPVAPAGGDPTACMAAYFPADTFQDEKPSLAFVCDERDPRKGATRLLTRIVHANGGKLTGGMDEWSRLQWHELAVFTVLRRACCTGTPPIELPAPEPPCPSLAGTLEQLGESVAGRKEDVDLRVLAFEKAAFCVNAQPRRPYRYQSNPYSGGQVAFEAFIKRNLGRDVR